MHKCGRCWGNHNTEDCCCERCGSKNHITGFGACSKWGKWWPYCCYCWEKDVDVREHGAYYGCHKCLDKYYKTENNMGPDDLFERYKANAARRNASQQNVLRTLSSDAARRKDFPIATGVIDYFPLALGAVAELSRKANDQHNPGQPLHWSRHKSRDHADCLMRHFIERGTIDTDGISHTAKVAWRALAMLQEELEAQAGWEPK